MVFYVIHMHSILLVTLFIKLLLNSFGNIAEIHWKFEKYSMEHVIVIVCINRIQL